MAKHHSVLIGFFPYEEATEKITEAIAEWISNPTNLQYFPKPEEAHWSASMTICIEGPHSEERNIRLVGSQVIQFMGTLKPAKDLPI